MRYNFVIPPVQAHRGLGCAITQRCGRLLVTRRYIYLILHTFCIWRFNMPVKDSEAVMLRVSPKVKAEIRRFQGELQAETGRLVNASDAVERLLAYREQRNSASKKS
jgi:hypothetical protein